MNNEYDLFDINLQLFASDDEQEEESDEENEEESDDSDDLEKENDSEDESEGESDEESDDESTDESEVKKKPVDKKTAAIIKQKQENKKLRDELASIKKAEKDKQDAADLAKKKKKLVDDGFSEETASRLAKIDVIEKQLTYSKYERQAEKLESKYPDVMDNLDRLVELAEKTGWTLEKVCKAELEPASEYDIKTKAEQELLYKKKEASEKKHSQGTQKDKDTVKLSSVDEKTYQNMIKLPRYKSLTKAKFKEIMKDEDL